MENRVGIAEANNISYIEGEVGRAQYLVTGLSVNQFIICKLAHILRPYVKWLKQLIL